MGLIGLKKGQKDSQPVHGRSMQLETWHLHALVKPRCLLGVDTGYFLFKPFWWLSWNIVDEYN